MRSLCSSSLIFSDRILTFFRVRRIIAASVSPVGCASWSYLLQASQPYARAPFYQFSEQTNDNPATNSGTNPAYTFLTGHGVRALSSLLTEKVASLTHVRLNRATSRP